MRFEMLEENTHMAAPPRQPSQPHAVPGFIPSEITPVPAMGPTAVYVGEGEARHMDVEETIRMMALNIDRMRRLTVAGGRADVQAPLFNEAAVLQYEKKISRVNTWGGGVWGAVAIVALIFTSGIAYAVFMGANATDAEVAAADKAAIIEHNGGVDPEAIDAKTHRPVGEHPDMQGAIQSNTDAIRTIQEEVLPPIVETQKKLDKRSEYQYELTKHESKKAEARRKRKPAPGKGPRLEALESQLLRGDYN